MSLRTFSDIASLRHALGEARRQNQRIGLVPTMGNLHKGHIALVEAARSRADIVIASIFINPLQFGRNEDLENYPRTLADDQTALEAAGCDMVFTPTSDMLYPQGLEAQTTVRVPKVSEGLCGARRPGHFEGVATIVTMLFNLVQPDIACFGEKDYQQLAVIRKLVKDLHLPIEIVGVPTVRAEDGLALSSRNGYLNADQRAQAPRLYQVLAQARDDLEKGMAPDTVLRDALGQLAHGSLKPDYLELRRDDDLGQVTDDTRNAVLLGAVHLGPARLIDNIKVTLPR